jgi:DNA (cytosine-5)-methyltransferase 1
VGELVLSLFPGLDVLGMGFEAEGFCVVQGPDVIFGRDVRDFHLPPGRFDGIIGGDPCQSHSAMATLVRAKGLEPSFPDMTGEFQRVVEEAQPRWFLRENVPKAPDCKPVGYEVRSFLLDHSHLDSGDDTGNEQMRRRRFWFGMLGQEPQELRRWIDFALFALPVKVTAVGGHDGHADALGDRRYRAARAAPVGTGRHEGAAKELRAPPRSLEEMLRLQGLPEDLFGDYSPYTMQAKRKLVGNAVPLGMAKALARAVRKTIDG